MSKYDEEYEKARKIWDKCRKAGWLSKHLKGNAKGKIASKEAFMAGYMSAIVNEMDKQGETK
jgi:hypothetical protein